MWGSSVSSRFAFLAVGVVLCPFGAYAADDKAPAKSDSQASEAQVSENEAGPWYFFMGNVNNHPKLERADQQVDEEINKPLRLIAPGFDDIKTFSDQRDDFMIWTPFVGVGRQLSLHWDLFAQAGYTAGRVRTHETDPSLLILPLHTDITIYRSSFFAGLGLVYYPWEFPDRRKFDSIGDRLKSTKPFVGTTLSWNHMTYEAKVKLGLLPFANLIHTTQKDAWDPWSSGVMIGANVPLSESSAMIFNVQYTFFWTEGEDFSGPGFTMFWQKYF